MVFSALAVLSFAVLSANMLHVLIASFNAWLAHHPSSLEGGYLTAVWRWSITSTLFQDFAEAIVKDNARSLWTQAELWNTLAVCLFMGRSGQSTRRH